MRLLDYSGLDAEVGAVKAGAHRTLRFDLEPPADVIQNGGRGCGGQRQYAFGFELACKTRQLEVVGAEIVPPLRDAMRLVHGKQGDPDMPQHCSEAFVVEALRRDVEQSKFAASEFLYDLPVLIESERGVKPAGADAFCCERIDLILHQRDQWRDDQGHTGQQQRGQLITERLPSAGGEHCGC